MPQSVAHYSQSRDNEVGPNTAENGASLIPIFASSAPLPVDSLLDFRRDALHLNYQELTQFRSCESPFSDDHFPGLCDSCKATMDRQSSKAQITWKDNIVGGFEYFSKGR